MNAVPGTEPRALAGGRHAAWSRPPANARGSVPRSLEAQDCLFLWETGGVVGGRAATQPGAGRSLTLAVLCRVVGTLRIACFSGKSQCHPLLCRAPSGRMVIDSSAFIVILNESDLIPDKSKSGGEVSARQDKVERRTGAS